MDRIKTCFRENHLYLLLWAAFSAVMCLVIFPPLTADFINYDSSYQYFLTQHDMAGIFRLLPEDYSPPLYAVALKLFSMLFGETLYVMRVFNLGAAIGMMWLAAFPVRRAFGVKSSVICCILFACSVINLEQLPETRPTYYSLFLTTAVMIYAYLAFFGGKKGDLVLLTVYAVLAMYTHNIAMLGALGIYVTLLLFALIEKDKKKFVRFFISGGICAVVYIPWLLVVFRQFGNVKEGFFKTHLDSFSRLVYITVMAPFRYDASLFNTLFGFAVAAVLCIMVFRAVNWKSLKGAKSFSEVLILPKDGSLYKKAGFAVCCYVISVLILVAFVTFVYPMAVNRYFHIFSGMQLLIMAAALGNIKLRVMPWIVCAACALSFGVTAAGRYEQLRCEDYAPVHDAVAELGSDAVFLHCHEWSLGTMSYYFPEGTHYVSDSTYTVLQTYDVFTTDVIDIGALENITEYADEFYIVLSSGMLNNTDDASLEALEVALPQAEFTECGMYNIPCTFISAFRLMRVQL